MANSEPQSVLHAELKNLTRRMNIDRVSHFIIERDHFLGLLFLIVAGISILTGKTLTRGQGLVSCAKEPKTFWFIGAAWFLAGIVFMSRK
jgi:hypothetical protein